MRHYPSRSIWTSAHWWLVLLAAWVGPLRWAQADFVGNDMLTNGNFETGHLAPWFDGSDAELSTTDVHMGQYAYRATTHAISEGFLPLIPGHTYELVGWFKWNAYSGTDWGTEWLTIFDPNWNAVARVSNLHSKVPQAQWYKVALSYTATTTTTNVFASFGYQGPVANVDLLYDDFQFFEKSGNQPPTANVSASATSGPGPLTVNFQANADDPDGAVQTWNWDFGDGIADTVPNPTHTFQSKGSYAVTLTIYDNDGAKTTQTVLITVTSDSFSSIAITGPTSQPAYITSQAALTFSGTASAPAGRTVAAIYWDNINTDVAGIVSFTPAASVSWTTPSVSLKPGKNEILMTCVDSDGYASTAKLVVTRSFSGPIVSNVQVLTPTVSVYGKYEIQFDLQTVADNPYLLYDVSPPSGVAPGTGVTVDGVFTSPSGKVLRQPGFFYRETNVTPNANPLFQMHFEETNKDHWRVRFSPQEQGSFSLSLHIQDGSGVLDLPVGSFSAGPPMKPGFIGVSKDDSRYFEFSNRDLFWPVGPAWQWMQAGDSYDKFSGSGLNLERPWMIMEDAYTTNASRWYSTALALGNEGFMHPLTWREHYPSHELSRWIYYPQGRRIWMGPWMDDRYCPLWKSGSTYLVKARIYTTGLVGPVTPGVPYGFMIKTHGWPTDTLESDLRPRPSMIPVVSRDRGWHTVVATYTATSWEMSNPYISLFLDNVSAGDVRIDEFSVREILPDGSLGGEQIRDSRGDLHTYVEQRAAAFFDWQLERGEADGIFFKYVIMDKNDWVPNHLLSNGSWSDTGDGYYQSDGTKAKWHMQQWWRYLAARWGYSTAVHSWELNNEGPPGDWSHQMQTQSLGRFMHTVDSHPHLVTTSFWWYADWEFDFWRDRTDFPDVGYADLHKYSDDDPLGMDFAAFEFLYSTQTYGLQGGIPVVRGETGIGYRDSNNPTSPHARYFQDLTQPNPGVWYHNLIWAGLNYGSMMDPNYWWQEHFYNGSTTIVDRAAMARPFSSFIKGLDMNRGGYVDAAPAVSNPDLRVFGQKNVAKLKAHLWIQNKNHTWRNVMGVENPVPIVPLSGTVKVNLAPNRTFRVDWWNTATGVVANSQTLTSDSAGNLTLTVSNLSDDIAVKIAPPPSTTPPAAPRGLRKR